MSESHNRPSNKHCTCEAGTALPQYHSAQCAVKQALSSKQQLVDAAMAACLRAWVFAIDIYGPPEEFKCVLQDRLENEIGALLRAADETPARHIGHPQLCEKHSFYYFPCPQCQKETCTHGVNRKDDWCPECDIPASEPAACSCMSPSYNHDVGCPRYEPAEKTAGTL